MCSGRRPITAIRQHDAMHAHFANNVIAQKGEASHDV